MVSAAVLCATQRGDSHCKLCISYNRKQYFSLLLLTAGADAQTDSSSDDEDVEYDPLQQGQSPQALGNGFISRPLGMHRPVMSVYDTEVQVTFQFGCVLLQGTTAGCMCVMSVAQQPPPPSPKV